MEELFLRELFLSLAAFFPLDDFEFVLDFDEFLEDPPEDLEEDLEDFEPDFDLEDFEELFLEDWEEETFFLAAPSAGTVTAAQQSATIRIEK